jgi:hypothetical protein
MTRRLLAGAHYISYYFAALAASRASCLIGAETMWMWWRSMDACIQAISIDPSLAGNADEKSAVLVARPVRDGIVTWTESSSREVVTVPDAPAAAAVSNDLQRSNCGRTSGLSRIPVVLRSGSEGQS